MNTYERHRFPPDIISCAVWLYYRFNLSHRDREDLLAERCLTVKDEATGYCLAIKTGRHLQSQHVKAVLRELIAHYGIPRAIRSDNGTFRKECLNAEIFGSLTEARIVIEQWRCPPIQRATAPQFTPICHARHGVFWVT